MRYLRTLSLVTTLILSIPCFFFLWLFSLLFQRRSNFSAKYSSLIWAIWGKILLMSAGIYVTIDGSDQFSLATKEEPIFILAKHSSFLDVLVLLATTPELIPAFISKKPVLAVLPFFDRAVFSTLGVAVPVYLKNSTESDRKSKNFSELLRLLQDIVKNKIFRSIVAFPEGTRLNSVGKLHHGIFDLAFSAQQGIIIPIVIENANNALPKYSFWLGETRNLVIKYGQIIHITEYNSSKELIDHCHSEFIRLWK